MTIKEQLLEDMKVAMKEKDTIRKDAIQMVRAAVLQYEKDNKAVLEDDGVIEIIAKEVKRYRDVLPDYEKGGRDDLISEVNAKIEILMPYLPKQLTEQEVKDIVQQVIAETGASSMKDMGKVMGAVIAKTKGRADGKVINNIVKECLNA